jgi:hypothetical protein
MQAPGGWRAGRLELVHSEVWVSTLETVVHAHSGRLPAATPADRCALLVTESGRPVRGSLLEE